LTPSPPWATSTALVWNNLPVMLTWGAIVLALFLLSLATGMLGLIIVFPVLGHGTWHAYRAVADEAAI
jgi:Predicted integral membrane protein